MLPLAERSFGMYGDAGALAVQRLVASVLWLALEEVSTEHVYAAVKLGLRTIEHDHPEAGDSAVRDEIHDYLEEAWGLSSSGFVFHFDDFAARRRVVCDWDVPPAPRDAHARLAAVEWLAGVGQQQLLEAVKGPTVNLFHRLAAGRALDVAGRPQTLLDEGLPDGAVYLRDAGALAELSLSGRLLRLPWPTLLSLLSSLDAGCGPQALQEHALAVAGT